MTQVQEPGTLTQDSITDFLRGYTGPETLPEPAWGPIGREVYERTYSRVKEDGSREVWAETVRRVVNGNIGYAPESVIEPDEAIRLFDLFYNFKASPAGRHLWTVGAGIPWSRNCFVSGFSSRTSDHFRFLAMRLFEGGGVGSNYSNDLISMMAPIQGTVTPSFGVSHRHSDYEKIVAAAGEDLADDETPFSEAIWVQDSREGWVSAWTHLIELSTQPGLHNPYFEVSAVRPYGAPLKTFGGTASGPAPLVLAIKNIASILNGAQGRQLNSLEVMEIDHEIASAVVAGGARRSARMSLKHWADDDIMDFINCKADHSKHWSTNISVETDDDFARALFHKDAHAEAVLSAVTTGMALNGEPGLMNSSQHSEGEPFPIRMVNPCAEASLSFDPIDGAGESCNLGSVNLDAFGTDLEGATEAFRLLARYLYRATLNPYPEEAASRIEARNRRIGVGILGLQGWAAQHGKRLTDIVIAPELQKSLIAFRKAARFAADEIADALGTPRSVKVTAIAPTGTIAQLSGATPGVHPVFARHFIRRVRFEDTNSKLADFERRGYPVIKDVYAANTMVVEFPQKDALVARYGADLIEQSDELTFTQFLDLVNVIQETFCYGNDGQAVSATGQIPAGTDPKELEEAIKPFLYSLKGITVFPDASGRQLAPYERITEEEFDYRVAELAMFEEILGDSNDGECDTGACPVR